MKLTVHNRKGKSSMCRKLPYPRCAYHARIALSRAIASGDLERIEAKTDDFYLSATGIRELQDSEQYKTAEKFQARRNAIIRRIKNSTLGTTPTSIAAPNNVPRYVGTISAWEVVEERARINVAYYSGKGHQVTGTGRKNSTNSDILVKNRMTGKSGYIEVKKLCSRGGLQAVLTEHDGTFFPSTSNQGVWVDSICSILNSKESLPVGKVFLTDNEQNRINHIIVDHYKNRNIIGLMYTDKSGKDFSLSAVDEIPDNVNIILDAPRHKASGSSPWSQFEYRLIPEFMEMVGFHVDKYDVIHQGKKTYIQFDTVPDLDKTMVKNQKGYTTKLSFNDILPQLSAVEGSNNVFELRKRSKVANPTVVIRFGEPKTKVSRYKTQKLHDILSPLATVA